MCKRRRCSAAEDALLQALPQSRASGARGARLVRQEVRAADAVPAAAQAGRAVVRGQHQRRARRLRERLRRDARRRLRGAAHLRAAAPGSPARAPHPAHPARPAAWLPCCARRARARRAALANFCPSHARFCRGARRRRCARLHAQGGARVRCRSPGLSRAPDTWCGRTRRRPATAHCCRPARAHAARRVRPATRRLKRPRAPGASGMRYTVTVSAACPGRTCMHDPTLRPSLRCQHGPLATANDLQRTGCQAGWQDRLQRGRQGWVPYPALAPCLREPHADRCTHAHPMPVSGGARLGERARANNAELHACPGRRAQRAVSDVRGPQQP
jgi:hypothetical protein